MQTKEKMKFIILIQLVVFLEYYQDASANSTQYCEEEPPKIKNGVPVVANREHGFQIWYRCNPGTKRVKYGNVRCLNGSWIGEGPECRNDPCDTSELNYVGLVKPSQRYIDSSEMFDVVCERGYKKSASVQFVTCKKGKWNIMESPCDKEPLISDECQVPKINYGYVTEEVSDWYWSWRKFRYERAMEHKMIPEGYFVNSTSKFSLHCDYPYAVRGMNRNIVPVQCVEGNWSQDIACELAKNCTTDIPSIRNGRHEGIISVHHGSLVKYVCKENYKIAGNSHLQCLYGKWRYYPRCEEVKCPELDSKVSFNITYTNDRKVNSYSYYTCKNITQVAVGSRIRKCLTNGEWSGIAPNCTKKSFREILGHVPRKAECPELEDSKGKFNIMYSHGLEIGSTAIYTCRDKKNIFSGRDDRTCLSIGAWSSMLAECSDVTCPMFQKDNILNVSYSNGNKMNSVATFSCPSYTKLIGAIHSTCLHDGTWSASPPNCEDITCPMFQTDNMLNVSYSNDNKMNSVATFSCPSYTKVVGAIHSTCLHDRTWSASPPNCEALVNCTRFQNAPNLQISYPIGVSPNSIAMFNCTSSTILVGNFYSICQHNGTWNHPLPSCENAPSGCVVERNTDSHLRIQPLKDRYRSGEFILLSCPIGEELKTGVKRLMCLGGKWSPPLPDCE